MPRALGMRGRAEEAPGHRKNGRRGKKGGMELGIGVPVAGGGLYTSVWGERWGYGENEVYFISINGICGTGL